MNPDIGELFKIAFLQATSNKSLEFGLRKIYNIVDDDPAPREEVFVFAQNLVKRKWPGQELKCSSSETTEVLNSRQDHREEKRVSNTRMKQELGVKLLFPTYHSGLLDIVETIS